MKIKNLNKNKRKTLNKQPAAGSDEYLAWKLYIMRHPARIIDKKFKGNRRYIAPCKEGGAYFVSFNVDKSSISFIKMASDRGEMIHRHNGMAYLSERTGAYYLDGHFFSKEDVYLTALSKKQLDFFKWKKDNGYKASHFEIKDFKKTISTKPEMKMALDHVVKPQFEFIWNLLTESQKKEYLVRKTLTEVFNEQTDS